MESPSSFISTIALGIAAFAATNIDDVLLLAAFFADARLKRRSIVCGQFLGIAALVAASATAAVLALVIPPGWIALLGLVPLFLGVNGLREMLRAGTPAFNDDVCEAEKLFEGRTHSQMLAVAAVTIANGGDNLGVYVPLFAAHSSEVAVFTAVFAGMTALWCTLGLALVRNRWVGERVSRVAQRMLPFVLIALGLTILSGAQQLLG